MHLSLSAYIEYIELFKLKVCVNSTFPNLEFPAVRLPGVGAHKLGTESAASLV